MKTYQFEYTNQKYLIKLFIIFIFTICALTVLHHVIEGLIGTIGLLTAYPASIVLFFVLARKAKRRVSATISDSFAEIVLPERNIIIRYHEIKRYKIEHFRGGQLNIWLKNGSDFGLSANSNFCNPARFNQFLLALDKSLKQYNIQLEEAPSIFLRAWMLMFLIILSAGLIIGVVIAIYLRKTIPPGFYLSFVLVGSLWAGYFAAKKKVESEL